MISRVLVITGSQPMGEAKLLAASRTTVESGGPANPKLKLPGLLVTTKRVTVVDCKVTVKVATVLVEFPPDAVATAK